ncbi:MAG TPA: efflux RND transporter periplasmic adaptor subunit [Verrucomicrobiota bacterium]|nr:efflux RND transporter periplasmic adaptor subunit [Verrucomicrobiota bacterium]
MLFRRLSFYFALAGIAGAVLLARHMQARPPVPPPVAEPARSPYDHTVAATGLIEAARENVRIASPKGALVTAVQVRVGDRVQAGAPLFQLDDREARARIATTEAQLGAMTAQRAAEEVALADAQDQLDRFLKLRNDNVASEDDLKRRWFAVEGAKARIEATKAQIAATASQLEQARTDAAVLTVKAPREGQVLQVNVREGEFAPAAALAEPLMLLGDVDKFQVRCDVDEQNSVLVQPGQPAVASLKGHADLRLPLRFVRVEPYVVPKRSLTGDSLERVDTRVLQLIYEFDRPTFPVYVGQQVDVFIERVASVPPAPTDATPVARSR